MSEFVECQNCGRKFFSENTVCPYCGGGGGSDDDDDAVTELMRTVVPSTPGPARFHATSRIFDVLFHGFAVAVAVIALGCFLLLPGTAGKRLPLAFEALFALVTFVGVVARRRWGLWLAIVFVVWTAALAIGSWIGTYGIVHFEWALGPAMILLFLYPLLSPQARDRFSR